MEQQWNDIDRRKPKNSEKLVPVPLFASRAFALRSQ
jgi:hypothetical protein